MTLVQKRGYFSFSAIVTRFRVNGARLYPQDDQLTQDRGRKNDVANRKAGFNGILVFCRDVYQLLLKKLIIFILFAVVIFIFKDFKGSFNIIFDFCIVAFDTGV